MRSEVKIHAVQTNVEGEHRGILYRGFEKLEHAREFVEHGIVCFGSINMYRTIEDAKRRDTNEGEAVVQTPAPDGQGYIDFHVTSPAPTYVLCLTTSEASAREFGPHVVRINDVGTFQGDIIRSVGASPPIPNPRVKCGFVEYTRGYEVNAEPGVEDWVHLRCYQKAPSLAHEQEYRIALIVTRSLRHRASDPTDDHVFVRLDKYLSYCELLPGGN